MEQLEQGSEAEKLLSDNPQFSQQHAQKNKKLPGQMCEEGRVALKENKYLQASKCFAKGVIAFEFLLKNNLLAKEQIKAMLTEIMLPTYSNLSLCHLKMGSYESVVSFCNQILNISDSNSKARYRRGLAFLELKKFDEAIRDFTSVSQIDPEMKIECQNLIRKTKAQMKKQRNREQKIASAFLGGMQDRRSQTAKIQSTQNARFGIVRWIKQKCASFSSQFIGLKRKFI